MAHMHCMLVIKATNMLMLCNTYCVFTAKMVARTHFSVTCIRTLPMLITFNSVHSHAVPLSLLHILLALSLLVPSWIIVQIVTHFLVTWS